MSFIIDFRWLSERDKGGDNERRRERRRERKELMIPQRQGYQQDTCFRGVCQRTYVKI